MALSLHCGKSKGHVPWRARASEKAKLTFCILGMVGQPALGLHRWRFPECLCHVLGGWLLGDWWCRDSTAVQSHRPLLGKLRDLQESKHMTPGRVGNNTRAYKWTIQPRRMALPLAFQRYLGVDLNLALLTCLLEFSDFGQRLHLLWMPWKLAENKMIWVSGKHGVGNGFTAETGQVEIA